MRPILPLLTLLLCACDTGAGELAKEPELTQAPGPVVGRLDRSNAGTPAPSGEFEDPSGDPASFTDFRGKPLLVNLWATWCAPCVAEMPTLDRLAAANPNIQVLAISQDLNGQEKVDAFFKQRNFERLEAYIDPEISLMTALKVNTLPTTILYDAEGREVWRMTGMEEWTGSRAMKLLKEAG